MIMGTMKIPINNAVTPVVLGPVSAILTISS